MELGILGELRVTDAGADMTPRGQRSRDLLAVLLLRRGQPVDAATLLDLVWGEDALGLAPSVVHTQIARVRRAIGNDVVERSETGYRLVGITSDADEFADLVQRARAQRDTRDALELVEAALGLWRGEDAYLDVADELVETEVVRLRELRTDALELCAELLLRSGDDAARQALEVAESVIARAPMRERGHELAMSASWRLGRQADALAAYDRLRRVLRDELGVDPGPSARELHARMLAQDPSLMAAVETSAAAPRPAPAAPTTRLIGRAEEQRTIDGLLAERRIVSLVGPGGVGKSRLLADLHQRTATRPATYVDLASTDEADDDQLLETVARALGLNLGGSDPQDAIITALAPTDTLLLLDEAERNVEAVGRFCSSVVRQCPRVSIAVASRRALDVVGEATLTIVPLSWPPRRADPAEVAASPAVRLLRDRISDHIPDVDLDPWLPVLAAIARRVDGLPLALELVAGHVRTRPVEDLESVLEDPVALTTVEVDRPERHRSLGDVVRWSVERVPAEHAAALRSLGVFVGPFSMEAACAVVGTADAERVLRALVRECLVHMERTGTLLSLRLLRPVRDLALADLALSDREEEIGARHRHRRWHAERWRGSPRSDEMLFDVHDHYGDYLAALEAALDTCDARDAADLVVTLSRLWSYTDMLRTGLRWSERVIDSGLLDPVQVSRVRTIRSTLLFHHDPGRVQEELDTAIAVLTEADDPTWLVTAHLVAALERGESGDGVSALEHGRRAVEAARRTTAERQADALGALAVAALVSAPDEAETAALEAWSLARRSGSSVAISSVAANVSWALIGLGRPEDARSVLAQTMLERSRIVADVATRQDPDALPTFLRLNLAWCDLLVSNPASAIHGFSDAIAMLPESFEDRMGAEIFLGAGAAMAALEDPRAPELLAGATAMIERTALALLPWQRRLLEEAIGRSGGRERWRWGAEQVPGERLAALVRDGAGHDLVHA